MFLSSSKKHKHLHIMSESAVILYSSIFNRFWIASWNLLFLNIVIFKLCSQQTKAKKRISIFTAICIFLGQSIGWLSAAVNTILFGNFPDTSRDTIWFYICSNITTVCLASSYLLMYLFMDVESFIIFRNTSYQVSNWMIYLHFTIFCILVVLVIAMVILTTSFDSVVIAPLILTSIVLATGGVVHMAYLFNKIYV